MKTLILYYSLGGNTKRIAQMIGREIDADLVEIETVEPYTGSYNDIVDQGQEEVNSGYLPPIKPVEIDWSAYDKVVLGSPVWWYTFAPAVNTFLKGHDFTGKEVYPFATNGGWIGHTFPDFVTSCKGAHVHEGLNIKFNGKALQTPESQILAWIQSISR